MTPAHRLAPRLVPAVLAALVAGCGQAGPVTSPGAPSRPATGPGGTGSRPAAPAKPPAARPASPGFTATQLEVALRVNPNQEARAARCRTATAADRRAATPIFGATRRQLFVCLIALPPRPPELFYVPVQRSGCFTGERRAPGRADWGCITERPRSRR